MKFFDPNRSGDLHTCARCPAQETYTAEPNEVVCHHSGEILTHAEARYFQVCDDVLFDSSGDPYQSNEQLLEEIFGKKGE